MVERALAQGVQIVTRRGRKTVVILSFDEYERLTNKSGSLTMFLRSSAFGGSELTIERDSELPRDIKIEP